MSKKKPDTESRYANRRKKIIKQIKGEAALFCAAPEIILSRDQQYPFRQNSDFFYLTGLNEPEAALVLVGSSRGPRSMLFLRDRDPIKERWTGERLGLRRAKRRFQIDEIWSFSQFEEKLLQILSQSRVLHYAAGNNSRIDQLVWKMFQSPVGPRLSFPHTIKDSRLITSAMRITKDRQEITTIRHVCDITAQAFLDFLPHIREAKSEKHGAQLLEAQFARLGAHGTAFPTIVASGKNATVLHHLPSFQPLWKRELVLIDAGAMFNGYAGDLTRTLPVSGVFSKAQAKIYDIVHSALNAAIEKARPGSSLDAVHNAAVRALTNGLLQLGLLRGSMPQLVQEKAYKNYFMHRTGHWLGLDVHDISPIYCDEHLIPPTSRLLEPGNVFTIEPGLYFDPKDQSLPPEFRGIGIRLEEDILITNSHCEVLTARMPVAREDIESLMGFV